MRKVVDSVPQIMQEDFGTVCLITDPKSDKFLKKVKPCVPSDRYARPCGGKWGFDDFVERWHE